MMNSPATTLEKPPIYTAKSVVNWLYGVAALVFAMILVGAITRLTESGLSIVEWKPLIGAIPPLNEAQWHAVFEQYKATPEFQKKNFWMEMSDFKNIFFWEWLHRFLGRFIGIAFALPYLYFLVRKKIPQGYQLKLFALFILGGLQGALGWYMVQSGLVDRPSVSHYRLAAHLSLALLIYAALLWNAVSMSKMPRAQNKALFVHGLVALAFLSLTIIWGAFVAGLDAGLVYNEFPQMGGGFMPPEMWQLSPAWHNIFENIPAVQFAHRWIAMISAAIILSLYGHALYKGQASWPFHMLGIIVCVQVGLGIATLLSGVSLPIAAMHQGGAVLLLSAATLCLYKTSRAA